MSKVTILDGSLVSEKLLQDDLKLLTNVYNSLGSMRRPKLAVITIGNDDASKVYIRNKQSLCEKCNITFLHLEYNNNASREEIEQIIERLNEDSQIDGILIQQPFPDHLKGVEQKVVYYKDVDGFTSRNIANTLLSDNNINNLYACTPWGILRLLDYYNIDLTGKNVVILGRSNIVGKPLIGLLLQRNATVISCNSYTENINELIEKADVLISAIGNPKFIKAKDITFRTQIIIDVGINRDTEGKLCGDVDYKDIVQYWNNVNDNIERYITPVPKGIGPMTVESLIHNIIIAYKNNLGDMNHG